MAKALGQAVAGHGADMVAVTQQPVSIPIGQFEKVHNVAQIDEVERPRSDSIKVLNVFVF